MMTSLRLHTCEICMSARRFSVYPGGAQTHGRKQVLAAMFGSLFGSTNIFYHKDLFWSEEPSLLHVNPGRYYI